MLAARRTPSDQLELAGRSQQRLDGQGEQHEEADASSDSAPDSSLQDLRWGERSLFVLVLSEGPKEGSVEPGDRSRRDHGDEAECDEDDRHKPHKVGGATMSLTSHSSLSRSLSMGARRNQAGFAGLERDSRGVVGTGADLHNSGVA